MGTNDDPFNGKTLDGIDKEEAESGESKDVADGKWGTMVTAVQSSAGAMIQGGGALGADEYEGTEGETAYHTGAFMYMDPNADLGYVLAGPAFTETVVGGAATLAAGATIAATMLF